ncbi:hypothetical protein B0J11DRAFT_345492 [Dendryphion nanum]|uniref:Uncharacterized protein n=1 Tax=Dendryphion nanum TaxID=256645 RepID=A0A9P9DL29_9PLEO|nr:hypothetical protein B0J11DRAFT_345492 [Dendryphion nanum]
MVPYMRLTRTITNLLKRRFPAYRLCRRHVSSASNDEPSWFHDMREEMLKRRLPALHDQYSQAHNTILSKTLSPFLPRDTPDFAVSRALGSHLTYFNHSNIHTDKLLSDGTDALHSPGDPFNRRLWAGGNISVIPNQWFMEGLNSWGNTPADVVCYEKIKDVRLRGSGDNERVQVDIARNIGTLLPGRPKQNLVKESKWFRKIATEQRQLVFFKSRNKAEREQFEAGNFIPVKYLPSRHEPEFSHSLTPTPALLFRFSALTFNAHAIHLDRDHTRNVEGHRALLVHGPLSLSLLLAHTSGYLKSLPGREYVVESIDYRHLAPLYCNEPMRLCGRETTDQSKKEERTYDVWIEGPTGGIAVTGTVRAIPYPKETGTPKEPKSDTRKEHDWWGSISHSTHEPNASAVSSTPLTRLTAEEARRILNPETSPTGEALTRKEKRRIRARAHGIPIIRRSVSSMQSTYPEHYSHFTSIPNPTTSQILTSDPTTFTTLEPTLSPYQYELAARSAQKFHYVPQHHGARDTLCADTGRRRTMASTA